MHTDSPGPKKLADIVYDQLLEKIVRGDLPLHARLPPELELAAELKVSRPIVREALSKLRSDGLIASRRGSGSYVTRVPSTNVLRLAPLSSIADMQRCFEFRIAFEGESAFFAAQPEGDRDLSELTATFQTLEQALEGRVVGVEEDFAFHLAIARLTRNRFFEGVMLSLRESICTGMNVTRNLSLMRPRDRLVEVQREHADIHDAIVAGQPEAARQAMRRHLENAKRRVFEGVG